MSLFEASPVLVLVLLWIQSGLLLGLAWAAAFLFSDRQSKWKMRIWLFALLGLPCLPLLNSLTAAIDLGWQPPWSAKSRPDVVVAPAALESEALPGRREDVPVVTADRDAPPVVVETPPATPVVRPVSERFVRLKVTDEVHSPAPNVPSIESAAPVQEASAVPTIRGWKWVGWIYLAGAAFFLGRVALGWFGLVRLRRTARPVTDREILNRMAALSGSRRLRRVVLLCSDRISTPIAIGTLRPAILLPTNFLNQRSEALSFILAHEMEHHRRRDPLRLVAVALIRALFWPQPLVWIANREVMVLSEVLADQGVIRDGGSHEYATLLVTLAENRSARSPKLAHAWLPRGKGAFLRRIDHLLTPKSRTYRTRFLGTGVVFLLSALLLAAAPNRWISTHHPEQEHQKTEVDMKTNKRNAMTYLAAALALSQPLAEAAPPQGNVDSKVREEIYLAKMQEMMARQEMLQAEIAALRSQLAAKSAADQQQPVRRADPSELNNRAYQTFLNSDNEKELRKALSDAQSAVEAEPKNSYYLDTLAALYYKLGDVELGNATYSHIPREVANKADSKRRFQLYQTIAAQKLLEKGDAKTAMQILKQLNPIEEAKRLDGGVSNRPTDTLPAPPSVTPLPPTIRPSPSPDPVPPRF